jgi:hypothetical protein
MFGIYGGTGFGARGRGRMDTTPSGKTARGKFTENFSILGKRCQNYLSNRNHILFDAMYQETNTATAGHDTDGL